MNFLLTNSVPLNSGDEALLRATVESIKKRFPGSVVTTLCKDMETARKYLPDLDLESDLEFVTAENMERVGKLYRDADIVLSVPGGFLHDFYSIEERLQGYEAALALHKPLILLGQSIGPFWKPESLLRLPQVLNGVARICVSDSVSKQHLLDAGVHGEKIRETGDMCFLWREMAPQWFYARCEPLRTIGLGLRIWPSNDTAAENQIIAKAEQLCRSLLEDRARELVFFSTCQGIPGYVDDSALAVRIVEQLPDELRTRCRVNRLHLQPPELVKAFHECDAYITMRLPAAMLAMLAGTPAMALGYERRSPEAFGQLGLESFQVPFESDAAQWLACVKRFLEAATKIRNDLPSILDQACHRAQLNLTVLDEEVRAVLKKKSGSDTSFLREPALGGLPAPERELLISSHAAINAVQRTIPRTSRFILVDDQQWVTRFSDRNPIPFLERNGQYWGLPADDQKAISELERLRGEGAEFIVFASPCFWWLDFYHGFHSHLQRQYQHAFGSTELIIFDLRKVF